MDSEYTTKLVNGQWGMVNNVWHKKTAATSVTAVSISQSGIRPSTSSAPAPLKSGGDVNPESIVLPPPGGFLRLDLVEEGEGNGAVSVVHGVVAADGQQFRSRTVYRQAAVGGDDNFRTRKRDGLHRAEK